MSVRKGRKHVSLPRWNPSKGWVGGSSRALYAFTDNFTGQVRVKPGKYNDASFGPNCEVRLATRAEAEELWQSPLHAAWQVAD